MKQFMEDKMNKPKKENSFRSYPGKNYQLWIIKDDIYNYGRIIGYNNACDDWEKFLAHKECKKGVTMDSVKTKYAMDMKFPLSMGVLIRDDGTCKFSGRDPTIAEYNKYMDRAEKLREKRDLEKANFERELRKDKGVWKLYKRLISCMGI